MNILTLTIPSQSENKTFTYSVKIKEYDNTWTTVYTGKVFVQSGQTKVNIDIEDIIWNYRFRGEDYFAPDINNDGDNYKMCVTYNNLDNYWYNDVKVEIPDLNVNQTKTVKFYTDMFVNTADLPSSNTVALWMNYQPVCHIPSVVPSGFYFRQLVWNGSFIQNIDSSTSVQQRNNLGVLTFTGGSESYGINGTTIAKIDDCPKPYYLAWLTNTGAMQVQGFLKSSEFSTDYDRHDRVDMSDFTWNYKKNARASWKLKSENLSDEDYKAFGEMFNSPYLILIDTTSNKMVYVNIKDSTYNEKKNSNKKKIYFEITVESCELKTI